MERNLGFVAILFFIFLHNIEKLRKMNQIEKMKKSEENEEKSGQVQKSEEKWKKWRNLEKNDYKTKISIDMPSEMPDTHTDGTWKESFVL